MEMNQDVARVLFEKGATLILLDVPEGTEFGIDFKSWYVGPKFKGIKMIPPGPHFFFYSAVDKYGQHALRNGMFIFTKERDVIVKRWNAVVEDFHDGEADVDEVDVFRKDLENLDSSLGPYPYEQFDKWKQQTHSISIDTFHRLNPLCGKLTPLTEIENSSIFTKKEMEKLASVSSMGQDKSKLIRFTPLPTRKYPSNANPADITKYSMDSSYAVQELLKLFGNNGDEEILGEAQFAFIAFLYGHVYDAFEHWKNLVHLLATCEEILSKKEALFSMFTDMLHRQLQEIPQDFFVDIVSQNNFLVQTLKLFFSNFESPGEYPASLEGKVKKLKRSLVSRFDWDFESDNPEDEPVVVET